MSDGFDLSELDGFSGQLIELAENTMPTETKKFLRGEGNKLRKLTSQKAKQLVKKDTGNYLKGIKRGKVYTFKNDETAIRVYGSSPHAHLIEYGHRKVTPKDGVEIGFTEGFHVFEKTYRDFEPEFNQDIEKFIDDMLDKGLR